MSTDIVVVGGGIAGLTCAVALADAGLSVTVLEKEPTLGGRARSWIDPVTKDPVSIGPHILLNHYPNFFQLLERLDTTDQVVWQPAKRLITVADEARLYQLTRSPLPAPWHFALILAFDPKINLRDIVSNGLVTQRAFGMAEEEIAQLDGVTALDYLLNMGVSRRFIERFWSFTSMSIMNVPIERCSAAALLRFFRFFAGHRDVEIGFPRGGLGDMFAPQAMKVVTEAGGRVLLGAQVASLLTGADGVHGVRLSSGEEIRARHVVAAVPPTALRGLLPQRLSEECSTFGGLDSFEDVPYISLYLWFDKKLTDMQFWARGAVHGYNCDFYDLTNIHPEWRGRPSIIASNIIYSHRAAHLSDAELINVTVRELSEVIPGVRRAQVKHASVHRIPAAIHAPLPNMEGLRPRAITPIRGLLLAGDWTRTGLPASMEGAAASGWIAAEAVLSAEGRPRKLVQPMQDINESTRVLSLLPDLGKFPAEPFAMTRLLQRRSAKDENATL